MSWTVAAMIVLGMAVLGLGGALFAIWRRTELLDSRIDYAEQRASEARARVDTIDRSLGDLDIRASKGVEANKTRIQEFKKEQNGRCDKLAKRIEVLEDAAGNLESVGNLTEEVKSFRRRMLELDALEEHREEALAGVSKLAMTNQEAIRQLTEKMGPDVWLKPVTESHTVRM